MAKLLTKEQLEALEICETEASSGCHDCPMQNEDCGAQNVARHMLVLMAEYEELKKDRHLFLENYMKMLRGR